ncbi:MAG: glycosyltransferase family 39 protein, partial [bacterium]|nr:glycosyltransferase family 39 protein [bacterium]
MFKKYKREIFIIFGLVVTYLVTRLANLTILPIFTDEAIYLRWSQIMAYDAGLRFLPLTDGKPPLFFWGMMVVIKILQNFDILFAGRLTSVLCGLLGLSGIAFTAWVLFKNKKISVLASVFYILSPFAFVYDRMAMADSLLAGLFIWATGLSVLLVKTVRLDVSLILGVVTGFGLLTKSPAIFSVILFPLLIIFKPKNILKVVFLLLLSFGIAEMFFAILRLFPLFNMITSKNAEFTITLAEFLKQPFGLLIGNLKSLLYWEYFYLTLPITILVFYALYKGLKKNLSEVLYLSACFLLPLVAMASFNKVIYARYLLMFTMPILILAAYGLSSLKKIFYIPIFSVAIITIVMFMLNPLKAPLLQADR